MKENLDPIAFSKLIEDSLFELLCENEGQEVLNESQGLHCNRDTTNQVEFALRMFPKVLFRRQPISNARPIHCQIFNGFVPNTKAVAFVPLLAELEKEYGHPHYSNKEDGCFSYAFMGHVLRLLGSYDTKYTTSTEEGRKHHQHNDNTFLSVMKELRRRRLFKKEDITNFRMLHSMLDSSFPYRQQRFQYMLEWDPQSLLRCSGKRVLLHDIAHDEAFATIFEIANRFLPKEVGGLFHKNIFDETSYQIACKAHGKTRVEAILDKLTDPRYTASAFLLAASSERIHLDGVYIHLRRDPGIVKISANDFCTCNRRLSSPHCTSSRLANDTTVNLRKKRKRIHRCM